jgi:hypothetical protein
MNLAVMPAALSTNRKQLAHSPQRLSAKGKDQHEDMINDAMMKDILPMAKCLFLYQGPERPITLRLVTCRPPEDVLPLHWPPTLTHFRDLWCHCRIAAPSHPLSIVSLPPSAHSHPHRVSRSFPGLL